MYSTSRASPVRAHQRKRPFLLAFLQKSSPAFGNHRLEAGLRKIIQTAADDLFPRETQELAGADTGLPVVAIVVRDQNGDGRLEDDRPEQQLEFLRTIFREPSDGLWLRGGAQKRSPLRRRFRLRQPGKEPACAARKQGKAENGDSRTILSSEGGVLRFTLDGIWPPRQSSRPTAHPHGLRVGSVAVRVTIVGRRLSQRLQ